MERVVCPFTARATWAGEVVAESSFGGPAWSWPISPRCSSFPWRTCGSARSIVTRVPSAPFPVEGGEVWSTETPERASRGATHGLAQPRRRRPRRRRRAAHVHARLQPGHEWLAGLATFDHRRVVVELVDPMGKWIHVASPSSGSPHGETPRSSSTSSMSRPPGRAGSAALPRTTPSPACRGGQPDARAGHRGGRSSCSGPPCRLGPHGLHPGGRCRHSRCASKLEEVSAGRSFTTLAVDVTSSGRRCAVGTLLLDVTAPDLIRHSIARPDVPGPYACEPYDMSVTGRDIRVVGGGLQGRPRGPGRTAGH